LDLPRGKVELRGQPNRLTSTAISRDGTRAITARTETAWVWDTAAGAMLRELPGHKDFIHAVAFSLDGTRIATGAGDRIARVWDAASGGLLHELKGHDAAIQAVAFSADGVSLVTASSDQTARLWDADRPHRLSDKRLRLHPRHVVPKSAQAYEPQMPFDIDHAGESSESPPAVNSSLFFAKSARPPHDHRTELRVYLPTSS
jgi:WD40 repeat protein